MRRKRSADARRYATSITRSGAVSVRPDLAGVRGRSPGVGASAEWRRRRKGASGQKEWYGCKC